MGKIRPDAVRAVVNSIGNLVYYLRDGENCVRAKSAVPYTSNTPAQQLQKAKFGNMTHLASMMKHVAKVGFPQRKRGFSATNAFHSANKKCYLGEGEMAEIDYEHLKCSSGTLFPSMITAAADMENGAIKVTAEAMPEEVGCNANDMVYVVALEKERSFCRLLEVCERSKGGTVSIKLSGYWRIENVVLYTFTVTDDGLYASETLYVGLD